VTRPGFGGLIGVSMKMQRVYKMIEKVSQHEYPVLVLGEVERGKSSWRESIHFSGPRKDRPFRAGGLFGAGVHAESNRVVRVRQGRLHRSRSGKARFAGGRPGGTLFWMKSGTCRGPAGQAAAGPAGAGGQAVGSTERRPINVRIIAATNRDLDAAIRSGTFRQDLYFPAERGAGKLPPLRDRKSDIPILVTAFLEKFSDPRARCATISEDAMRRLIAYDWPGNVRELENAIERAVALGSGPSSTWLTCPPTCSIPPPERTPEKDEILPLEELERRAILALFAKRGATNFRRLACSASERPLSIAS